MTIPKSPHLLSLERDGFVLVQSFLSPEELSLLRATTKSTTEYARAGNWPHVRTVPKQFPPWNLNLAPGANPAAEGIWGVQFLLHPSLPGHEVYTRHYFSKKIRDLVKELLQCEDEDLVLELFNMLVRPEKDFELRWHRDDIPPTATDEEELARLEQPAGHAQWNLALYDDESLIVVPGSHARARTAVERAADPFEKNIPGQMFVKMKAGDIVFYNNNIFHRGAYDSSKERLTLHGTMGHVSAGKTNARNILQHGIGSWVDGIDLRVVEDEEDRKIAEGMKERLLKLGRENEGDVGYSLEG
ncbi:hypothetical protein F5884DRAFT_307851 [Xylogone sp. PMI_703]|nr:hypothetical protein F5884DRAFT_307851 [Xylogone sp. PMI_703]